MTEFQVKYENTPNPDSLKFTINSPICQTSKEFTDPNHTKDSPLATKLFGFPWVSAVFIGPNFITLNKQDWIDWDHLADPLCRLIKEHLDNKEPIFVSSTTVTSDSEESETIKQIRSILDNEIRPAVAMDGGDVVFHKYENHIVYVFLKGACSGCPRATITLKMGIEARLKEAIPEIKEVVSA